MISRQKITPFLWFDSQAEEAASHYVAIFENSKILSVTRYGDGGPGPKGSVMIVEFVLDGQPLIALNGGPIYKLSEAFSLSVNCESQEEVDDLWAKLVEGGQPSRCGWLKDKFGLSWQIVPSELPKLLSQPDPAKAKRVMAAMMQMSKIDTAKLRQAADASD